jgi:hypothetical protein
MYRATAIPCTKLGILLRKKTKCLGTQRTALKLERSRAVSLESAGNIVDISVCFAKRGLTEFSTSGCERSCLRQCLVALMIDAVVSYGNRICLRRNPNVT